MCFSATASFTAGTVLAAIGIACIAQAPNRRAIPFAAIPLIFGLQQLTEGGLWLALSGDHPVMQACFTTGFSFFAQILWPLYVPIAVGLIETDPNRRRLIALCGLAGAVVGVALAYGLAGQPMQASIDGAHIFYRSTFFDTLYNAGLFGPAMAFYLAGTCLSPLLSSDRHVQVLGAAMGVAFAISYVAYETWLISVWCFFAAGLSALIWLRLSKRARQPAYRAA